jgi:hypothetical protein
MTRTKLFLLLGIAASAMAVIVVGTLVAVLAVRSIQPQPETDDLPDHALTPEETFAEVAPQKDGTVQIRQRLIFEAPPAGEDSVGLWISDSGIGEHPVSGHRLEMMPVASKVTAVELSTDEESTRESPRTEGDLDIDVETKREEGFKQPAAHFSFRPQDSDSKPQRWSEGRHAIEVSYVLDKVFLTVAGEDIFVLPLSSLGAPRPIDATHTMTVDTDGPLYCPADNVEFALGTGCTEDDFERAAQISDSNDSFGSGARLIWNEHYSGEDGVVAFDPPTGMTVRPIHPHERR